MREFIFLFVILSFCTILNAQNNGKINPDIDKPIVANSINRVDFLDTVIFNIAKAIRVNPNFIDIPISIKVDDDINSLDFSLRFNQTNLKFHSIINHTGYISVSEYYNPNDATLRFSSNSLTRYDKDTLKLISIRFEIFSDKIQASDLNSIMAYLNGDPCSIRVIEPKEVLIASKNFKIEHFAEVYPNPASDQIHLFLSEAASIEFFDFQGNKIYCRPSIPANSLQIIATSHLKNGYYLLNIFNSKKSYSEKIVILR